LRRTTRPAGLAVDNWAVVDHLPLLPCHIEAAGIRQILIFPDKPLGMRRAAAACKQKCEERCLVKQRSSGNHVHSSNETPAIKLAVSPV
jgi:hypothetical protein